MHCWRPLTCHFSQACLFYCWSTFLHARPAWPPSTEGWCTRCRSLQIHLFPTTRLRETFLKKRNKNLNSFFFNQLTTGIFHFLFHTRVLQYTKSGIHQSWADAYIFASLCRVLGISYSFHTVILYMVNFYT